jgi:hypothetical protein
VDRVSFPVWRKELRLPDSVCYQVEGRLPEKHSTPKGSSQKPSAASKLRRQLEKQSEPALNPVRVQSHGDNQNCKSVSRQQSTAEATVKTFSCRQKKGLVASPVTLPKKVCLVRLDKSLHQKATMDSSTVQPKKTIMAHKRSAQEVIVTPTPEVIVTPISKDISRISKRRRLCQKDSAAQSGDLPQVILSDSSDKAGHKLEVLFKKLESELTIIRRASSRAEELYERIRTLRSV